MNFLESLAFWIVVLFGLFFMVVGCLMLLNPEMVRRTIAKAGSTTLINYGEISLRMIPGAALVIVADFAKYPMAFTVPGWFILATSVVLFFVPPNLHHAFSSKGADMLKPLYLRLIFPFAVLIGGLIIWNVI